MTIGRVEVLEVDVKEIATIVQPLPKQVKQRWECPPLSEKQVSLKDIEEKLEKAKARRQEFHQWTMDKGKDRSLPKRRMEKHISLISERLQTKLKAAEIKRQSTIEEIRAKAQTTAQRREAAVERLTEKAELVSKRLQQSLEAAEERKAALQDAERDRLAAAHELALAKLTRIQQSQLAIKAELSARVEAKLEQAITLRDEKLALTAARASARVERAKRVNEAQRSREEEQRNELLSLHLEKLALAERRRQMYLAVVQQANSANDYLQRQAIKREQLRRQVSTRRLQHVWREFTRSRKTTRELMTAFANTGLVAVSGDATKIDPSLRTFDAFASRLQSRSTISAATQMLRRIEKKLLVRGTLDSSCQVLLKKLFPKSSGRQPIERYPVRVFLSAFMIVHHPQEVLDVSKTREKGVITSAHELVRSFTRLCQAVTAPLAPVMLHSFPNSPIATVRTSHASASPSCSYAYDSAPPASTQSSPAPTWRVDESSQGSTSFRQLYADLDAAWLTYLDQFVTWKGADAEALEADLIRAAVEMEKSMMRKCSYDPASARVAASHDLSAVVEQVRHDHQLLRDRLRRLNEASGVRNLEAALAQARRELAREAASLQVEASDGSQSDSERSAIYNMSRNSSDVGSQGSPARPSPPLRKGFLSPQPSPQVSARTSSSQSGLNGASSSGQGSFAATQAGTSGGLSNEAMLLEVLHNPAFRLPSQEVDQAWDTAVAYGTTAALQPAGQTQITMTSAGDVVNLHATIRQTMERALWDSIAASLVEPQGGCTGLSGVARVAGMVSSMAEELRAVVPEPVTAGYEPLLRMLAHENLLTLLAPVDADSQLLINFESLMSVLSELAKVIQSTGAPARAEILRGETQKIHASISNGCLDMDATVKLIVRAIRLLHVQLQYLKIDMANARLKMLYTQLGRNGCYSYLRGKLLRNLAINESSVSTMAGQEAAQKLPNLTNFTTEAMRSLRDVERYLQSMGYPSDPALVNADDRQRAMLGSLSLRSGIRAAHPSSITEKTGSKQRDIALALDGPVAVPGWQATLRLGLIHLVAGADPAGVSSTLPETLRLDSLRLHTIQNDFQQTIVLSACLLVLRNQRVHLRLNVDAGIMAAAAAQLRTVLLEPSMGLAELTSCLAALIVEGVSEQSGVSAASVEGRVSSTLSLMLSRDSGAFKALCSNLVKALYAHCCWGSTKIMPGELSRGIEATLRRCGAEFVQDRVAEVAKQLQELSSVQEGIYSLLYKRVYDVTLEEWQKSGQGEDRTSVYGWGQE